MGRILVVLGFMMMILALAASKEQPCVEHRDCEDHYYCNSGYCAYGGFKGFPGLPEGGGWAIEQVNLTRIYFRCDLKSLQRN